MRETSFEIKTEWEICHEFTKQRFDKLPNLYPGNQGTETSAGKIPAFDPAWDKVKINKPKKL